MNELPVVLVHNGPSWYLPYVVRQAIKVNPSSEVILLGNDTRVKGAVNVDSQKYANAAGVRDFSSVYRHMSYNSHEFELFCFQRWFYLLEYMRETGTASTLYLDSDCLLYSSAESVRSWMGDEYRCGLSIPRQDFESLSWCASGHVSFWTLDALELFCDFAIRTYSEDKYLRLYERKWTYNKLGGICDMTALYLFWLENESMIHNMIAVKNGFVCDNNINDSANLVENEYLTRLGTKRIVFDGDMPILIHKATASRVKMHALHCQGSGKMFIPADDRDGPFEHKSGNDLVSYAKIGKTRAVHVAKTLLRPLKRIVFKSLPLQR